MDVGRRDLGEVKKLFEERQEREPEPHVELLLREIDSVVCRFLGGYGLSVHKLKGNTVWNTEAFTKLPYVQLVNRLLPCIPPRTRSFRWARPHWMKLHPFSQAF